MRSFRGVDECFWFFPSDVSQNNYDISFRSPPSFPPWIEKAMLPNSARIYHAADDCHLGSDWDIVCDRGSFL